MSRVYDLVVTHKLDADDFFLHRVQQHCAERGLNFFLIEPLWAEAFHDRLARGEVRARVLLNMHSEHHDPADIFHRVVRVAHERGAVVIDPPDVALKAFNKAATHARLEAAGIPVPPTLVIPREHVNGLLLSDENRAMLGSPFVIKPSMGYGRKGVVMDATGEADLARSVALWPDAHYLLQRRIVPGLIEGEPAYFRAYHVFGEFFFCWWNCFTDRYRVLTGAEMERLGLAPLGDFARRIASLTGMKFFSTEVAQTGTGAFVVIDYVNDQCHLATQSAAPHNGVPDEIVAAIARRLVEGAQQLMRRP
ncbi:MAG: hypothetical protein HY300_19045 [Verrucomicrobia bacterium]|nr:hypothetical protein [Verrucomicrobiota bacterium]